MKLSVQEGQFKMLKPARSRRGYWIVGAIVGSDAKGMTYTKRVEEPKGILPAILALREKIHKDQPGIIEIYGEQ